MKERPPNPLARVSNPHTPINEFHRQLRLAGTQKRLGEILGLSEQLIGKIVKGERSITLETAERLGFELVWRKARTDA